MAKSVLTKEITNLTPVGLARSPESIDRQSLENDLSLCTASILKTIHGMSTNGTFVQTIH